MLVEVAPIDAPITFIEDWNADRTECRRALLFRPDVLPAWVVATLGKMLSHL